MRLQKILDGIDIKLNTVNEDPQVSLITSILNRVQDGAIFVVYNDMEKVQAQEAFKKGAAVIVSEKDLGLKNQIVVDDVEKAYIQMCNNYFDTPSDGLEFAFVMGTHGKTTIANLIHEMCVQNKIKASLLFTPEDEDTLELDHVNHVDVFYYYKRLRELQDEGATKCIVEVPPHLKGFTLFPNAECAIFTTLHHGDFQDNDAFLQARERHALLVSGAGTAIINFDDASASIMAKASENTTQTYSVERNEADYVAKNVRKKEASVEYDLVSSEGIFRISLGIPGERTVHYSLAALLGAVALGVPFQRAVQSLLTITGVRSRMEVVPVPAEFTVIIDGAKTPEALENVLKTLRSFVMGKIITVMSTSKTNTQKQSVALQDMSARLSDVVLWADSTAVLEVEETTRQEKPFLIFQNRSEALLKSLAIARENDIILLAGHEHTTFVKKNGKLIELDERELVKNYFER